MIGVGVEGLGLCRLQLGLGLVWVQETGWVGGESGFRVRVRVVIRVGLRDYSVIEGL